MYWSESEMEQLGLWSARIEMRGEHIDTIKRLSTDSERHKFVVEKWLNKLQVDIPVSAPRGLPNNISDFTGMAAQEMFAEIMKYDLLLKDVYSDVEDTDSNLIQELLPNTADVAEFKADFKKLVLEESMHVKLCNRMIGGFGSIRAVHV